MWLNVVGAYAHARVARLRDALAEETTVSMLKSWRICVTPGYGVLDRLNGGSGRSPAVHHLGKCSAGNQVKTAAEYSERTF